MKIANALKPLMAWMVILLAFNHLVRYYLGGKLMNLLLHPSSNSSVFTFLGHSDSAGNDSTRPGYLVIHGRSAESLMTTGEIIESRGYPLEVHHVVTEDGYILEMKRIPGSKKCNQKSANGLRKKPVFLQHGMMSGDHVYLLNSNENALGKFTITFKSFNPAYILADRCFDVWVGNSRGTTYSRKHVKLSPDEEAFWEYSWDEMGRYDIPANIEYILEVTGQEKLIYVGHSLGCTLFYIAMIEHPHLNDKIETMISLAPTTSVANLANGFVYLAPFITPMRAFLRWTGTRAYHSFESPVHQTLVYICQSSEIGGAFCGLLLFDIYGTSTTYDQTTIDSLIAHYPSGGSVKTMVQFLQNYNSGQSFCKFDFGSSENLKRYGTAEPPRYNLSLVQAPVNIIYGENDPLAPPKDIAWLASQLGNMKTLFRVEDPTFSHGDFIWSYLATELAYKPLVAMITPPASTNHSISCSTTTRTWIH